MLISNCSTIRLYAVMPIQSQYPVHVEECVLPKSVENVFLLPPFPCHIEHGNEGAHSPKVGHVAIIDSGEIAMCFNRFQRPAL